MNNLAHFVMSRAVIAMHFIYCRGNMESGLL